MRLVVIVLAAAALAACGDIQDRTRENSTAAPSADSNTELATAAADMADGAEVAALTAPQPRPAPAEPEPEADPVELCWQDYCPCDPPQGGMDQMLCRRLRAGLPVDDEMMSAGAGFRDARQQMEEFEGEYGEY